MTLRVLVVEDDAQKAEHVVAAIRDSLDTELVEVNVSTTAVDAARRLGDTEYDLLVLDLMLPMRDGEPPREDAGLKLLGQLQLRAGRLPRYVMGLTSHEQLSSKQSSEFEKEFWQVLTYDAASSEWVERLKVKVLQLAALREQELRAEDYLVDLAIVTAVHEVELDAVLKLPGGWQAEPADSGDGTLYWRGEFARDERRVSVVAACADEMGMPASAALAMKIACTRRPRVLAMVGIAAGVKGDFGEILIADRAWDYGSGKKKRDKLRGSIFLPEPSQIPVEPLVKAQLKQFRKRSDMLEKIRNDWGEPVASILKTQMGPFASGAAVLEDREVIEAMAENLQRKLVGVEMEAYGVLAAARISRHPRPSAIVVKSICDFGDERKGDEYQAYAAYTSASFVYEFALEYIASPSESPRMGTVEEGRG